MSKRKIIIAIDGYSACGKSTTAKEVARHLGYVYIDTGAMYRAVTLYFIENYINYTLEKEVEKALQNITITFERDGKLGTNVTFLNGMNVEDKIRSMEVSKQVSEVSALAKVRKKMVALQQEMGKRGGIVMDGRDIGTTVFPEAELKLFMTADVMVRAHRRQKELLEKNEMVPLDEIVANIEHRDYIDTHRTESPLIKAKDAISIETTDLSIEQQVAYVLRLTDERVKELEINQQLLQREPSFKHNEKTRNQAT